MSKHKWASVVIIIQLALSFHARVEGLPGKQTVNAPAALVEFVDKLIDRVLKCWPLCSANLKNRTLEQMGTVAGEGNRVQAHTREPTSALQHNEKRKWYNWTQTEGEAITSEETPISANIHNVPGLNVTIARLQQVQLQIHALKPKMERRRNVIQEIYDSAFKGLQRKDMRYLEQHADPEFIQYLIGSDLGNLQKAFSRNHRELLALTVKCDEIEEELDEIKNCLVAARNASAAMLSRAKEISDQKIMRRLGRSHNLFSALFREINHLRAEIVWSDKAIFLFYICKRIFPIRCINPDEMQSIPPSYEGYLKIIEFYMFSDAGKYCFGDQRAGPNLFTHHRRNVAIFAVFNESRSLVYNQYAVSGTVAAPGAPTASEHSVFMSIKAAGHERRSRKSNSYDRHNDAEFKLLNDFAGSFPNKDFQGHSILWTRKGLCQSCAYAVAQFRARYVGITLQVIEDEAIMPYSSSRNLYEAQNKPGAPALWNG